MESVSAQLEIPIFPLPNVVFFPRTLLPLHIFEPRYRKMVSEVVNGNGRIGMVLARSNWDRASALEEDVYLIGGLGRISEFQHLETGDFDIVLNGLSRFRILEFLAEKPYRKARVELLGDLYSELPEDRKLLSRVVSRYRALAGTKPIPRAELEILLQADLVTLVNSICSSLEIAPREKQVLLEVDDVRIRAEALVVILDQMLTHKQFVARFSHLRPDDPGQN
jgi:Lon protease-like protein